MNWDMIEGSWKEVKGRVKESWGDLTDDELTEIEGKRDRMVGVLQRKYGLAKMDAEREVDEWADKLNGALDRH